MVDVRQDLLLVDPVNRQYGDYPGCTSQTGQLADHLRGPSLTT